MSTIIGFDACKSALATLISSAKADLAAKKDGPSAAYDDAVTHWQQKLFAFTHDTRAGPGEADAIADLNQQAIRIGNEIRQTQKHDIITRIDELSRQIEAAGGQFGAQALSNLDAAKRGRLLPIKNAIDSLTATVNQIKVLKNQLDAADPDEQKILGEIETLVDKFSAMKATLDAL